VTGHARTLVGAAAILLALVPAAAPAQLIGPAPPASVHVPGAPPTEPPLRAPLTITPTLTVSEEYNDNILLDNRNKQYDFITSFTPGIAVSADSTVYHLLAAYSFRADVYARDESRSEPFARHSFTFEGSYRASPALTLSLSDTFFRANDTNLVAQEGVSTGRTRSYSNSIAPGVSYRFDRLTTLRTFASYTILRFDDERLFDSDTLRIDAYIDRMLTPRLTGSLGYEFAYFDIHRLGTATVHTPLAGLTYRFTETLTGTVSGGPSFVHDTGTNDDRVAPTVSASLVQRLAFGLAALVYERSVGTAGGLGGTTDNQSIGAVFRVFPLRGLALEVAPRYITTESDDSSIDVKAWSLPLRVSYQINRYLTAVAGYQFFRQRSTGTLRDALGTTSLGSDVDQNRVAVGLQIGYPIGIE
jgi:hypothetical protein